MSRRFEVAVLALAISGLALFLLAASGDPKAGLQGWLASVVAWTAISLGCLMVLLMRVLIGTRVDEGLGPAVAAGGTTLPVAGLAFVPVLFGLAWLYPWTTIPPHGALKLVWLQPGFFAWRTVGYFILWMLLTSLVLRLRAPLLGAVGLIVVGFTGSMAAVDWVMSLEPRFHSSIFGMLFLSHAALAGWALAAAASLLGGFAARPQPAAGFIIGGIVLWAYLSFCQYLVIWDGNEPAEIRWYLLREHKAWGAVYWASSALEGVIPFFLLLPARMRASRRAVGLAAVAVVAGGLLEAAILVLPAFGERLRPALSALAAAVGLGGLWLLVFSRRLRAAGGSEETADG